MSDEDARLSAQLTALMAAVDASSAQLTGRLETCWPFGVTDLENDE